MNLIVHSNECPKLPDGRSQHFFVKENGHFICQNCREMSVPGRRWGAAKKASRKRKTA